MKITEERLEGLINKQKSTSRAYKPLFYRINNEKELKNFEELLNLPGIYVVDKIGDQISELVKLKNPGIRFSPEELKVAADKHIGNTSITSYGVWVYYPWSNRLVHILDEEEFIEVRTSRNQYKITPQERDTLARKKIGVIGLSVGQSVAVTLAMERICGELRLADFDVLELTNLNRIRTGIHNLGLGKAYSVAREVAEIDPFIKVTCFPEGLFETNLVDFFMTGGKLDLLVEESDGFDIKILSRYKARELGVPVIMEASDRCMVDVERFDLEPNRAILHGIVRHLDVEMLKELKTNEEKIPYMLDILGLSSTTPRLRASMLEMQQSITTWPQLASAVTMGGGITADVSRRMLLNHFTESGRYYVDIDKLIGNKQDKEIGVPIEIVAKKESVELSLAEMKKLADESANSFLSEINSTDLEKVVHAVIAAPSYANRQPWKILSYKNKLFIFENNAHLAPFPHFNKESTLISIGTAIENAVLKSEELGYEIMCETNTSRSLNGLAVILGFKKNESKKNTKGHLGPYIFLRQTNRKIGNKGALPEGFLQELTLLAEAQDGANLRFITEEDEIKTLSQLAGSIDRIRLLHPKTHQDYFTNEIRWKDSSNLPPTEGVDVKTLELNPAAQTALEVIADPLVADLLNKWEKGSAFEKLTELTISSSSAIGLISMKLGSSNQFLDTGRLAERIWLTAAKNNVAFQPICLPLIFLKLLGNINTAAPFSITTFSELNELKSKFSLIFNQIDLREAHFLFRLSIADKPSAQSLRKPLNEVYFKS